MSEKLPQNVWRRGDRYWVRVVIGGKRIRRPAGATVGDALALLERLRAEHAGADPAKVAALPPETLGGAVARFIQTREAEGRRAHTLVAYRQKLERWVKWLGATTPLASITRDRVAQVLRVRDAAPYTKRTELGALSTLMRWAGHEIKLPTISCDQLEPQPLDQAQLQAVLKEAERVGGWVGALVLLVAATGIRHSEAMRLRVQDLDLVGRRLVMPPAAAKTRVSRVVPLSERTAAKLAPLVLGHSADEWLFPGRRGRARADAFEEVRQVFEAAGVNTRKKLHALRATFATDHLLGGTDLETVGELAGWSKSSRLQVAAHYLRTTPQAQLDAIKRRGL